MSPGRQRELPGGFAEIAIIHGKPLLRIEHKTRLIVRDAIKYSWSTRDYIRSNAIGGRSISVS